MAYGDKRDHRKIDLYARIGTSDAYRYVGTTTWAATCKEAKAKFLECEPGRKADDVYAAFK
jgi:hypothetical protein